MSTFLIGLSYWLHSLATVVFIGHFVLMYFVYLPSFTKNQSDSLSATILSEISNRSRAWLYIALFVFIITGIYLTLVDANYLGLGNFGNTWSVLMLVKHIIVVVMIVLGLWYNVIKRVGQQLRSDPDLTQAFSQFRQYSLVMAIAGMLVLLLTAISQAQ